jgi:nucleoside-diphosphate-sugar epimerase
MPEKLRPMKAIVTGATGFLGRSFLRRLLDHDAQVCCIARQSSKLDEYKNDRRLTFVESSLARVEQASAAFENADVVFHIAAALKGGTAGMFLNNVVATRSLIDVCLKTGVKRLVLVSSVAVYGTSHLREGDTLDERCPLDAQPHRRDPYSYSKIVQEQVAWEAAAKSGLPLIVVRPGVIYGPGREVLVARVGLMFGNTLLRMGGNWPLPLTYVDNCSDALLLAGTTPRIEKQAFNIVDDDAPTGKQIVKQYRKNVRPLRVLPIPQMAIQPLSEMCERYHAWSNGQLPAVLTPYKSGAIWKPLHYSNRKAKQLLGWQPQVPFSEGLPKTLAALAK